MTLSLQFDGEGQLVLDDNGNPTYDRPPTGDLVLAMGVQLGSFHADPDLGSDVPSLTRGEPRTSAVIKNTIQVGLQRLEQVGTLRVEDVLVFEGSNTAHVYTAQTDQPFEVQI